MVPNYAIIGAIPVILIVLFFLIAFFWTLIHLLTGKNETTWKLLWAIIIIFLGPVGVILYLFIGRKERKR